MNRIFKLAEGMAFDDEFLFEAVDPKYTLEIKSGTEVYHGSEKEIREPDNKPTWFGVNQAISETYGDVVSTYELTKSLKCLNFREDRDGMEKTSQGYAIGGTDAGFKRLVIEIHKLTGYGFDEFKKYLRNFSQYGNKKHSIVSNLEHPKVIEYLKSEGFDGIALDDEPAYGSRGHWYPSVFIFEPSGCLKFVESYDLNESKTHFTSAEVEKALNNFYSIPTRLIGAKFERKTINISDIPNLKNYTVEKILRDYEGDEEHKDRVDEYADAIKSGETFPPIVMDSNGRALDGAHRVLALKKLGKDTIEAFVPVKGISEGVEEKQTWKVKSITGKSDFETNIPPEERTLKNLPRDSKKHAKVKFQSWLCLKKPEEFRGVSGFDASWGMAPDRTFYGWSHRALGSFKIGQEITNNTIGNINKGKPWTIKTEEEALKSAISFAKEIS